MHLVLCDLDTGGVLVGVELRLDSETSGGPGVANELNHGLPCAQGLATPVLGDVAEQAVLDLVPLAGARRKVGDHDSHVELVGPLLQLPFPRAGAVAVAPTGVRSDEQLLCVRIDRPRWPRRSHVMRSRALAGPCFRTS